MAVWHWLLLGFGLTFAAYVALLVSLLLAGRGSDARALATFIPDCIVLLRGLLQDPRVPRSRKMLLAATVGYLALPFDLIPDVIPIAGQLDDVILLVVVLRSVLRAGGPQVVREHWRGAQRSLDVVMRLAYRPTGVR